MRKAKENNIQVDDTVVTQDSAIPHKLTSKFNDTECHVTERNGNEVALVGNGKTMKTHISPVKRMPPPRVQPSEPLELETNHYVVIIILL